MNVTLSLSLLTRESRSKETRARERERVTFKRDRERVTLKREGVTFKRGTFKREIERERDRAIERNQVQERERHF